MSQDIDETRHAMESPQDYVLRMAVEKAQSAMANIDNVESTLIIGADTSVVLRDEVMGKPRDEAHAARMLAQLSGREHEVMSAVCICTATRHRVALNTSRVTFRPISPLEAAAYWHTGEPIGKAGGYAIQGLAAIFVQQLTGSYSGVMGLPLYETANLLSEFGLSCLPAGQES